MNKKLLIGLGIGGVVILSIVLLRRRKGNVGGLRPIGRDSNPERESEMLKIMSDGLFNQMSKRNKLLTTNQKSDTTLRIEANEIAIDWYNCMQKEVDRMSGQEYEDFKKYAKPMYEQNETLLNSLFSDITTYNRIQELGKKYPYSFEDKPCNNLCKRANGSLYTSAAPCKTDEITIPR
jgi:hypothetical protein